MSITLFTGITATGTMAIGLAGTGIQVTGTPFERGGSN